jgi:hypothetical protein
MRNETTTGGTEGGMPAAKRTATANAEAASNGPTASAEAKPATGPKRRLPAATVRALKELEAGNLNRYAEVDDLFRKLDIEVGKEG